MAEWQRTHTCGELRDTHLGQTVTLNGWVLITRNFPNQVFVDLRDRYGLTQVVVEDAAGQRFCHAESRKAASACRPAAPRMVRFRDVRCSGTARRGHDAPADCAASARDCPGPATRVRRPDCSSRHREL